ncbi:MAG: polysaccharide deacetylase family protein [Deltaproteobacteria bacterium]|nr:polysaccharide deacetylase family protein [Deltaproteobacteria bacterium]
MPARVPLALLALLFVLGSTLPRPASAKQLVVRCGQPRPPRVALTFDDGPHPRFTREILAILKEHKVKATFFVLGGLARIFPQILREIEAQGHLLANHSWNHPRTDTPDGWRTQIQRTQDVIRKAGAHPTQYYRPPHGIVTPVVKQLATELALTIVLYTVLSSDWQGMKAEALTQQVVKGLRPGGIVVLHDGGRNRTETVKAVPGIIKGLREKGLEPVRLDELLAAEAPDPKGCHRQ